MKFTCNLSGTLAISRECTRSWLRVSCFFCTYLRQKKSEREPRKKLHFFLFSRKDFRFGEDWRTSTGKLIKNVLFILYHFLVLDENFERTLK